ncbi:tRNA-binding protein [Catenulispora sp. GAS73]|uniref:tRNA-binding protein n=1 Tax=Catenulispora sp. GAS73 TaxID=3156269 RepID=UPI003517EB6D
MLGRVLSRPDAGRRLMALLSGLERPFTSQPRRRIPMSTPVDKQTIPAENFFSADIRVGRIVSVEDFPAARKPSYKIQADFGEVGVLHTSAQVTNYSPAELIDRPVVGVVNLGKKRIAGFTSEFLLLGSYSPDGNVHLLSPAAASAPGDVVG